MIADAAASFVPLLLVLFLFVASCSWSVAASADGSGGGGNGTRTAQFRSGYELRAYRRIVARMDRMEKASVKTIQASCFLLRVPVAAHVGDLLATFCLAISAVRLLSFFASFCSHAEPRRRRHPLRAGAPAAGVRPPQDEGPKARGTYVSVMQSKFVCTVHVVACGLVLNEKLFIAFAG